MGSKSVACRSRFRDIWSSLVAASITLSIVIAMTVLMTHIALYGNGEGSLTYRHRAAGARRQRRDASDATNTDFKFATSTPDGQAPSGDYFPVYRQVGGGRTIDWDSEQMSTDGFDVQSTTDFVENENVDYDDVSSSYEYTDNEETSTSNTVDVQEDDLERLADDNANISSLRGKEFSEYYSDFDDGQKFDEEQYETTFIKPGMHYGDNVEIVEQVRAN